jgi:hypothetical protein
MDLSDDFFSYPRTLHLEDSALQLDDEPRQVPFSALKADGVTVVYEEKVDGANAGFKFDGAGTLFGQSRGHYLDINSRSVFQERHFNLYKDWLLAHEAQFLDRFEDRYQVFGEFMGVTHSIFYDALEDYFLEFDIWDRKNQAFLDTPSRHELCEGLPIKSVPVLYHGTAIDLSHMKQFIQRSVYRTDNWRDNMKQACRLVGDDYDKRLTKMDHDDRIEGIYVKLEKDGQTIGRYKWVREGFVQVITSANEHWQSRFPVPNLLARQTDIYPAYLVAQPEPKRLTPTSSPNR